MLRKALFALVALAIGCGPRTRAGNITEDPHQVFGAIAWDGWSQDATTQTGFGVGSTLYTTYASRKPSLYAGDGATVGGGGWAQWTNDGVGHPVNGQSIVDSELAAATGVYHWLDRLIYPATEINNQNLSVSGIDLPYFAHRASTKRCDVKRGVMLQADWTASPSLSTDASPWTGLTTGPGYIAWLTNEFLDPCYMRIGGKPVLTFFRPSTWAGTAPGNANTLTNYNYLISHLPPVYKIGFGTVTTGQQTTLALDAFTAYDVADGAALSGNGRHPWSDQVTKDNANAAIGSNALTYTITVAGDGRPRVGSESTPWVDRPTVPDELTAFQNAANAGARLIFSSPWNEIDEAGPMLPTVQDGTRWIDPIRWVRTPSSKPGTYTYEIDSEQLYATLSGTWTRTTGIASPTYDGTEESSSTTNDTISITCDSHIIGSAGSATVGFRALKSAASGIADFTVAGASQGTVDLGAGSTSHFNLVKTVTCTTGQVVAFKVNGSHTIGSTNAVALDSFEVTYAP